MEQQRRIHRRFQLASAARVRMDRHSTNRTGYAVHLLATAAAQGCISWGWRRQLRWFSVLMAVNGKGPQRISCCHMHHVTGTAARVLYENMDGTFRCDGSRRRRAGCGRRRVGGGL